MSYSDDYKGKDNQPYKYNGKELDEEHGLNCYDYSARYYDPIVPRFTSIDPMAEKYYSISPYAYVANNPINAFDPDGNDIWSTNDSDEIERFFKSFQAVGFQDSFKSFDFSSWQYLSDRDFKEIGTTDKLIYDDKLNTISAYQNFTQPDNEATGGFAIGISKVTLSVFSVDNEAGIGIYQSPMISPQGGGLDNIYPEFAIISGGTKVGRHFLKNLVQEIWNRITYRPEHTSGIRTNGFGGRGKGERNYSGKASGTKNPFKHLKPDPKKPGNVLQKDPQTGKTVSKPAPPGYEFPK